MEGGTVSSCLYTQREVIRENLERRLIHTDNSLEDDLWENSRINGYSTTGPVTLK